MSQIGFVHGAIVAVRVDAGTLTEVVLQLFDAGAGGAGRAQRTARHISVHQHDACPAQFGHLPAHLAQTGRITGSVVALEQGQDPEPTLVTASCGPWDRASGGRNPRRAGKTAFAAAAGSPGFTRKVM